MLIVGINYAPEHSGIAPYTVAAAQHFAAMGNDVLVLAGIPHYPNWTIANTFRWRLRLEERLAGVRVRRLRHFVPSRQSALRRGLYEATFGAHVITQQLPWRPDVVLAVVPSLLGAAAAAKVARRHRAPLGIWVQDLMAQATAQSGIAGGARVSGIAGQLERWLVSQATGVAAVSDSFCSHLELLGVPADRVYGMPNWSHLNQPHGNRRLMRKRMDWPDDTTIALHSGNMGLKQGLENVIDAARLAATYGDRIRFVLAGDGSQRAMLQKLGRDLPSLQFLAPVPSDEYANVLAAADVLIVNERVGVVDMSLPSKLTSYFLAGRPVVAAVNPKGGTAAEIRSSRAGCIVQGGRPEHLLNAIRTLASEKRYSGRLGESGRRYARSRLDQDAAMRRLSHFVEAIIVSHLSDSNAPPSAWRYAPQGVRWTPEPTHETEALNG